MGEQEPTEPVIYTVAEARALLKIGRGAMYQLLRVEGGIVPIKIGSKIRIPASELERYINARHAEATRDRAK